MSSTLLRSKAGGIITEYDGRKVERVSDLPRAVAVPSWARPGPGPAVTENGCYVIFYEAADRIKSSCPSYFAFRLHCSAMVVLSGLARFHQPSIRAHQGRAMPLAGAGGESRGGGAVYAAALSDGHDNIRAHPPIEPPRNPDAHRVGPAIHARAGATASGCGAA